MSKKIKLGYIHMDSYTCRSPMVEDWASAEDKNSVPPDQIVLSRGTYTIKIDYPVRTPFTCKFASTKGITRRALVNKIVAGYRSMYNHADEYGVWGHCLSDLMLGSAHVSPKKVITLGVDS